ncbi:maltose ABC transporter permease MalF [Pseudaquabacterium pictum]|uniref:Maltose/maltodextrin transport system permease protein n=1 Tax=Pseudaquabacterium pictum TaxID=2315236 RepID=A0A480APL7_9BURK|nr:maltose ABC transporter permease MalF [Rubrivivax pictus]GCL62710.1 maltose transport system permease protein MalF [Rubrivivax pictus]
MKPVTGWLWAVRGIGALAVLGALALSVLMHRASAPGWAAGALALAALLVALMLSRRLYAWRYVLPGLLAVALFIVLPMGFTLAISLTNYSSAHLLSFDRATAVLLARTDSQGRGMDFRLHPVDGGQLRFHLVDDAGRAWQSAAFQPSTAAGAPLPLQPAADAPASAPLDARALVALLPQLQALALAGPDGLAYRLASLQRVADQAPRYRQVDAQTLQDLRDGRPLRADLAAGQWRDADGRALEPGFRTGVGLANYARIFGDPRFLQPFISVFAWTVSFATLNTLFTFGLGLVLAVAVSWPALRGRHVYRLALFLPYAVPAFISIPVFRGLFNENLGEINLVLDMLFGVRPGWFSDATLARAMVLAVNTWLGYPYMMILVMGLLQAIPDELYEASALAGAGPLTNLFRITLPLIARPMAPLLVASFAANFNNLTLIALLTEGAPDRLDTEVPVGATDLLASYTYRIAFNDGGQNYALACAISTLVFLLVAALAVLHLRLFRPRPPAR